MAKDTLWYPNLAFTLKVHDIVANEGLRDEAGLDLICHKVRDKRYETLTDKAAFLLYNIATKHPFINGNKRTALATALSFLVMNDYDVDVVAHYNDEETKKFLLEIAEYTKSRKEVKIFLEKKLKR